MSQSQGKPFYHHKQSGATSWTRPTADEGNTEASLAQPSGPAAQSGKQDSGSGPISPVSRQSGKAEKGPANDATAPGADGKDTNAEAGKREGAESADLVASAYAYRRAKTESNIPAGPSRWRAEGARERERDIDAVQNLDRAGQPAREGDNERARNFELRQDRWDNHDRPSRRARSPSPKRIGRYTDSKRFKGDDGRRSPPRVGDTRSTLPSLIATAPCAITVKRTGSCTTVAGFACRVFQR
jgi:hypothetical protein